MAQIDIKAMDRRMKWWLLLVSLATLVLMVIAAFRENVLAEWRSTRKEYAKILREKATDPRGKMIADQFEIRLIQNFLPELGIADRCVTCHAAVDDPRMADREQPFRTHPGNFLEHHPPERYGCTVCHQGQGRATELPDAHGRVPFWLEPLLAGQMTYTSCGRCHYENDLYGAQSDLYGGDRPIDEIAQAELAAHVPGAETIARGKQLVIRHGCLGCHKYRGRGGTIGPDFTYVGDKSVHRFDFTHLSGERTVLNWMVAHFKSPTAVIPDSRMPEMNLTDEQAHDLAVFMMSLKRKSAPADYTPLPPAVDRTPADGKTLYAMYCSACHGADGVGAVARTSQTHGGINRPREMLTPSLRNSDTLAVASDDYLRWIVQHGRTGTGMVAWGHDGGLSSAEMDRLVGFIRSWQAASPPSESIAASRGNPRFGRALYRSRCASCHGLDGRGGIGISLRSPSALAVASDEFLRDAIIHGRPNTAMPSWSELSADEVSDLIAHLRSWQSAPADGRAVLARLADEPKPSRASLRIGRVLYRANCANCHATDGSGALGPSLRSDEFLSLVNDDYLYTAIVHGRPGTAMPSWKHMPVDDVVDLIHYVRNWSKADYRPLEPYLARGDWDHGRIVFEGTCAGCHGRYAEGGTGPQLVNPVFLGSANDAMLREWIRYGRLDTAMRPFLRGQQGVAELTEAQIEDVVTFLRYNERRPRTVTARPGMGIVAHGAETFAVACASCHGVNGEGLVGPALSNPRFLRTASDGFLAATIILGRDGTEMQAMGRGQQGAVELTADDVANVVAFLRSWEHQPPVKGIPRRYLVGTDLDGGKELYAGFCVGCHGTEGKDGWAPALNNPDFLTAATDGFLQATIARGRAGTAMRSFGKAGGGVAPLSAEQIDNIVSYVRTWAPAANRPDISPSQPPPEEQVTLTAKE